MKIILQWLVTIIVTSVMTYLVIINRLDSDKALTSYMILFSSWMNSPQDVEKAKREQPKIDKP
ncbi:MAG: hypothetical protein ACRCU2_00455 [Planktothrix sp.]